jgi:hypothetical protein
MSLYFISAGKELCGDGWHWPGFDSTVQLSAAQRETAVQAYIGHTLGKLLESQKTTNALLEELANSLVPERAERERQWKQESAARISRAEARRRVVERLKRHIKNLLPGRRKWSSQIRQRAVWALYWKAIENIADGSDKDLGKVGLMPDYVVAHVDAMVADNPDWWVDLKFTGHVWKPRFTEWVLEAKGLRPEVPSDEVEAAGLKEPQQ